MLDDYSAPTPARSQPHPIPEGIDGVRRLLDACSNEQQRALIALCGLCGLRISEARAVEPSWFDLENNLLVVRGKGDKIRRVPLSEEAMDYLRIPLIRAISTGEPLVQMKDRQARYIITALGKRANLKRHISSHDLRATFATAIYDKTLDIRTTQELLGHSSVETTQGYTGITIGKMREAVKF